MYGSCKGEVAEMPLNYGLFGVVQNIVIHYFQIVT